MSKVSTENKYSRYAIGGTTNVAGNFIGWWKRKTFAKSPDDIKITLTARYHQRPDIVAYDYYKTSRLGWFVLMYNNILDITDFSEGQEIVLPTPERLFSELLTTT